VRIFRLTWAVLIVAFWAGQPQAGASTVDFQFNADLQTGPLAGTLFNGMASFDNAGSTGMGTEYLTLTSLDFSIDGFAYTLADVYEGGQAILQDGVVSYFTAAILAPSSSSPVLDIAFSFGGPNVIGYDAIGNPPSGAGVVQIVSGVPEPAALSLCGVALLTALFLFSRARRARRWSRSGRA
jgi:hypothetical protein